MQLWGDGCFEFTATPEAYPRLTTLRGVGGQVPRGLPPRLETLEYFAEAVFEGEAIFGVTTSNINDVFGSRELAVAARAIGQLAHLRRLTVHDCRCDLLPLSFVSQLPASIEVATFNECLLSEAFTFDATLSKWWAATPQHLQIREFSPIHNWDIEPEDPPGTVRATFIIESKASLRARGQCVGPLRL